LQIDAATPLFAELRSVISESAESQLSFLNSSAVLLTDRSKQADLPDERARLWTIWVDRLESDSYSFNREDGVTRSYLDVFLDSKALEYSVEVRVLERGRGSLSLERAQPLVDSWWCT